MDWLAALDILVVAVVIYYFLALIRETRQGARGHAAGEIVLTRCSAAGTSRSRFR